MTLEGSRKSILSFLSQSKASAIVFLLLFKILAGCEEKVTFLA